MRTSNRPKDLQNLGVQRRIGRSHQTRLPNDILVALEGSEYSARFTHAGYNGCDIPRIHSWVNGDVNPALAQKSVIDAISGPTEPPRLAEES